MRLENKVAIITGGAAGIGFAYAKRFVAEGARVVVVDVADPLAAAEKLGAADRVLGVRTDVSDAASVQAMVGVALDRFGRVDVLVNNAAVFATLKPQRFDEISEADWDRVMAVNVKGSWNCVRAVVPAMRTQGGGRIVNVASAIVAKGTAFLLKKLEDGLLEFENAEHDHPQRIRYEKTAEGLTATIEQLDGSKQQRFVFTKKD